MVCVAVSVISGHDFHHHRHDGHDFINCLNSNRSILIFFLLVLVLSCSVKILQQSLKKPTVVGFYDKSD